MGEDVQLEGIRTRFLKYVRPHIRGEFELLVSRYDAAGARVVVQRPVSKRGQTPECLAHVTIKRIGKPWESVHGLVGPAIQQIREAGAGVTAPVT